MNQDQDKHLNVFWHYSGKPWHEDNITRALMVYDESATRQPFSSIETSPK